MLNFDDLITRSNSELRFRIHIWDFSENDKIELKLNDVLLDNLVSENRSQPPLAGQWLHYKLKPGQVRRGRNTVQINVAVEGKSSNTPIVLDAVQLHVHYKH